MKFLLSAGGSGGHLLPAKQLASKLLKSDKVKAVLFAAAGLQQNKIFSKEYPYVEISSAPLRKNFFYFFWGMGVILKGFIKALGLIWKFKPDVVVGFGSYHTFPVMLAARILCKPIVLFEPNIGFGKVHRFFLKSAKKVAMQFPPKEEILNCELVAPLPWDEKLKAIDKEEAKARLKLKKDLPLIFVFGGSQGASFLNDIMPKTAFLLGEKDVKFQIVHLTGSDSSAEKVKSQYDAWRIPCFVRSFEKNISLYFSAADFVICRAGASTISELVFFEKPSLLIPFPASSENHQMLNALFLQEKIRAVKVLEQKNADESSVMEAILWLLNCEKEFLEDYKRYKSSLAGKIKIQDLVMAIGERK